MKKQEDECYLSYLEYGAQWAKIGKDTFHRQRLALMKFPENA